MFEKSRWDNPAAFFVLKALFEIRETSANLAAFLCFECIMALSGKCFFSLAETSDLAGLSDRGMRACRNGP